MALDFSRFGTPVQPGQSAPDFSQFGTPVQPEQAAPDFSGAGTLVAPVGIGALVPTPTPAPTGRVSSGLDISAVPEQFMSGVRGMQQSYYATAAKNVSEALNLMDRIDRGETVRDADDPLGYQYMTPEQRAKTRAQFVATLPRNVAESIAYGAKQQEYAKNPKAEQFIKAANEGQWGKAWEIFNSDKTGIFQQLSVQSAPNALPSLIGGAAGVLLRGGVPAMMAGLATGSFPIEYMSSIVDSLQDSGVDMRDARAVEAKLRDPAFLEAAGKKAVTRGTVISAADALGGKLAMPLRRGQLGKNVARGAANIGAEVGTEMGGEAAAQAATGEKFKVGDILAEGLGAGPQAVGTTVARTAAESRAAPQAAPFTPARVEPSFKEQAPAPEGDLTVEQMMSFGIPEADAQRIRESRAAKQAAAPAPAPAAPKLDPQSQRLADLTLERINAGVPPEQAAQDAVAQLQRETEAEAQAQGEQRVAGPVSPPSGEGVGVAGVPDTGAPAGGPAGVERTGVVPPAPDVGQPPVGERAQPSPVAEAPAIPPPPPAPVVEAPAPAPVVEVPARRTTDAIAEEIRGLETQRMALMRKDGRVPFPNSPARKKHDALLDQILVLKDQWAEADRAERGAQAVVPAPAPVVEAPAPAAPRFIIQETKATGRKGVEQPYWNVIDTQTGANPYGSFKQAEADATAASLNANPEVMDKAAQVPPPAAPVEEAPAAPAPAPVKEAPAAPAPAPAAEVPAPGKRGRKPLPPEDKAKSDEARRQQTLAANKDARDVAAADKLLNKPNLDQDQKQRAESIDRLYELSRRNKNKPGQRATELLNSDKVSQEERDRAKANYEAGRQRKAPPARMITPQRPSVVKERMPSLGRAISRLRKLWGAGKISDTDFANGIADAQDQIADAKLKQKLKKRTRGTDYLMERLLRARRTGELPDDGVELALWFLRQNPALGEDLGISIRKPPEGKEYIGGQYDDIRRVIELIKGADSSTTVAHEIMHHLERMLPEDIRNEILKSWANALTDAASRAKNDTERKFFNLLLDYHFGDEQTAGGNALHEAAVMMIAEGKMPYDFYQYVNPSEFWAVNAADILAGRYSVQGSKLARLRNWMSEFFEKVKDFFGLQSDAPIIRALDKVLEGDGKFVTNLLLSGQDIPKRQISPKDKRTATQIDKEVDIAMDNFDRSYNASQVADNVGLLQSLRNTADFKAYFNAIAGKLDKTRIDALITVLPTDFIVTSDAVRNNVPELENTNKLLHKMRGEQYQLLAAAQDLQEEIHRAFKEDPSLHAKLARAQSVTTDVRIDPTKNRSNEKLNRIFDALGPRGQALYRKTRDYYKAMVEQYRNVLDQQIEFADLPENAKNRILAQIQQAYEAGKEIDPYFSFVRNRGPFWLQVGKGDGRQFYTFKSDAERNAVMEYLAKTDHGGESVRTLSTERDGEPPVFRKGDTLESFRKAASDMSRQLKSLFDDIDESIDIKDTDARVAVATNSLLKEAEDAGKPITEKEARDRARDQVSTEVRDAMKDSIYEFYLATMPDQSFRNAFIARKDIPGYNVDVLRNFSTTASRMSAQLPRFKYGPMLRRSLLASEKSLDGNPDADKYMHYVDEVERRTDLELFPGGVTEPSGMSAKAKDIGAASVDFMTRAAFIHYMSAAASAAMNFVGIGYGFSALGARHGYGRATATMAKHMNVFNEFGFRKENADGTITYKAPSILYSSRAKASPDLQRALRDMMGEGLSEFTYSSEILGRGRVSTADFEAGSSKLGRGLMTVFGGLFQTSERMVREVLFASSYELSRGEGKSHEQAVAQAITDVYDSVGNMDTRNRAPIFRGAIGRVLLQFTSWSLFMTARWMREFKRIFTGATPQAKFLALKEFTGIMGTTFMFGGLLGLPFMGLLIGFASGFLGDEDDKPSEKVLKDLAPMEWWRTYWLPRQMGKITFKGEPLTDAVGMSEEQLAALIERGPANYLLGIDIASRASLDPINMFHREGKETRTLKEGALQLAESHAGPYVGMVLNYADAIDAFMNGDYQKGAEKLLPANMRNPAVAFKYYNEGIKDYKGAELFKKDALTTGNLLWQSIGFRMDAISSQQKFLFEVAQAENKLVFERDKIVKNLRESYVNNDKDRYRKWYKEAAEFTTKYPTYAIDDETLDAAITGAQERISGSTRGFFATEKNMPIFGGAAERRGRELRLIEEKQLKEKEK